MIYRWNSNLSTEILFGEGYKTREDSEESLKNPNRAENEYLIEDDIVQVTGTVRMLIVAEIERELGWNLDPELEVEFEENQPVLIATSMEVTPRKSEQAATQK